jgi:thiosulfate/3-mercaptopyruvate sulfurtransferase
MNRKAAFGSVIDADTLRACLPDPDWRVIDCRHDLMKPDAGIAAFTEGHLRGAVFAHLDRDLSGPRNGANGRHPLPKFAQLAERFRRWGIGDDTQIVAYDASGGIFAARLWWLARWLGHSRVAVLDGGWQAALRAGIDIESNSELPSPAPASRAAPAAAMPTVDAREVEAIRADRAWLLIDARAADRYEGRNETIDPVGGHIPGAVNRFWQDNLDGDGRFKPPERLRTEFLALLQGRAPSQLVAQCGSGVTACHHLVALERAGLAGARLYPGSWSEWITDPSRPVARGPGA